MADFVEFKLSGGDKFMVSLRDWEARLRSDVRFLAKETAENMAADQAADAPRRTGQHVSKIGYKAESSDNDYFVRYRVSSRSFVAHILDHGTRNRFTSEGWRRGRVLPAGTWVPTAIKWRRIFQASVLSVLRSPVPEIGNGVPDVEER